MAEHRRNESINDDGKINGGDENFSSNDDVREISRSMIAVSITGGYNHGGDDESYSSNERISVVRSSGNDEIRDGNRNPAGSGEEGVSAVRSSGNDDVRERNGGGLVDRLNEILVLEREGDLLMQENVREDNLMKWIQALDWQVMGACRVDERLKPFLKINAVDVAEDRLLDHLTQHFEASEVGLLARCLCVPLVSMRVGKVIKEGSLLCPTSMRGTLNLTLLPSSDLRLSFIGDNGQTERLVTLSDDSPCSTVIIEKIPADQSGRSFVVKLLDGETFYFWCSERSELLGIDLLSKMNDFLGRKPTLAELTGISKSRLECFATHLRAYLVGPTASSIQASSAVSAAPWGNVNHSSLESGQSSSTSVRSPRTRQNGFQLSKASLSPRPSSFKEGLPKTLSSLRSISKDKLRRRGDLHLAAVDTSFMPESVPNVSEKDKSSEVSGSSPTSPLNFLESLENGNFPPSGSSPLPPISSLFSPYYCWCPPCTSPPVAPLAKLPTSFPEPFSLPPLSTLLPASITTGFLPPMPPLDLTGLPPFELPSLLSDPLVSRPFTKQCSQPIPTFTPLICDSIVHIPVLDLCSLGQGYLVSAGPGMATSIPPLHPNFIGPIISEGESLLEKGARETLRLLIGSSNGQNSASLLGVRPSILSNEDNQGIVVTGSRGLYSGISDVNAMVSSFNSMGLSSLSERSIRISGLNSYSTSVPPEALEQSSCGPDLQSSTFMSMEDKKD